MYDLTDAEKEVIKALRRMRWGVVRVTVKAGRLVDLCEEKRTDLTKLDNTAKSGILTTTE